MHLSIMHHRPETLVDFRITLLHEVAAAAAVEDDQMDRSVRMIEDV